MARRRPDGVLITYKETWDVRMGKVWMTPYVDRLPRQYPHSTQVAYKAWVDSILVDMILSDSLELPPHVCAR